MLGHQPKAVLRQVLRAGGARLEQIAGAELFRCDKCDEAAASCIGSSEVYFQPRGANRRARDEGCSRRMVFVFFDRVQRNTVPRFRHGPSQRKDSVVTQVRWVAWTGWPVCVTCDRGLHNRGMFGQTLCAHGVYLRMAGVETAEQIGRCERFDGIFKKNLSMVVTACGITGKAAMKMAAATRVSAKNELIRQGGIARSQWVICKFWRGVGWLCVCPSSQDGSVQTLTDENTLEQTAGSKHLTA